MTPADWPKAPSYSDFTNVVTDGRKDVDAADDNMTPSFASHVDAMCQLDDIYV